MDIKISWFDKQFNVALANPGKEPFLEVKGCRIVKNDSGEFISWPSTKNEKTGKYWKHVYGSNEFSAVVLKKAKESQPTEKQEAKKSPVGGGFDDVDDDIPF